MSPGERARLARSAAATAFSAARATWFLPRAILWAWGWVLEYVARWLTARAARVRVRQRLAADRVQAQHRAGRRQAYRDAQRKRPF